MTVSEELSDTIESILCMPRLVLENLYREKIEPTIKPAELRRFMVINLKHDLIVHFIEQEVK